VLSGAAADGALERRFAAAGTELLFGAQSLERVASAAECAIVMAAIVGAAGLQPTLAAARAGKRVLLANKEVLVMAGPLFMATAQRSGAQLLPIDSEHNAVFQCLSGHSKADVRRIVLTASGGPFRTLAAERLAGVTPEEACAHPTWAMGRKISVDSATLMNKGLEVIEASWLFELPPERIEVVVHPQSIVHSLVEYVDGSVLAQLSNPDMRVPIAHAMGFPERIASGAQPLDFALMKSLSFERPDSIRFPCLELAYAALRAGGTAPAVLNAANEVAVEAFLSRRASFTSIPRVIEQTLERVPAAPARDLGAVLAADEQARRVARSSIGTLMGRAA
jgi:1-deoxy-D-xylulose-5-phosphate reductoisomerase